MKDVQATLDLIDGALEDYLSPDAMRWTPDEDQRAEVNSDRHGELSWSAVESWMERFMRELEPPSVGSAFRRIELTDWQPMRFDEAGVVRFRVSMRVVADQFQRDMRTLARVFDVPAEMLLHGNVYIKAPTRNPRMRALHAAYRHRQLARRRRNR